MSDIKAGDVVQLKSGGPEMTVSDIAPVDGGDIARVFWFAGREEEVCTADFKPVMLVKRADKA